MTSGAVHLVVLIVLAGAIGVAAARLAMPGRETWRGALAGLVAAGFAVQTTLLLLGTTLGLTCVAVECALAACAALLGGLAWRSRADTAAPAPVPDIGEPGRTAAARAFVGAAAGLWVLGSALEGTSFGIDDLTYHAALPARWLAEGSLHLAPFTYQTYYPATAETLTLWWMLPLHADAWGSLGELFGWLVAALAVYGIVRSLGGSLAAALASAGFVSVSRDMLLRLGTVAQPDVIGTGMALAALALLAPPPGGAPRRTRDALLAGLAAGLALGCKVSYAPVLAGVALGWIVLRRKESSRGEIAREVAVLSLAAAAAGGAWYLRDAILTGNPVYPAELGPFRGPLDAAAQVRTKLWTWIVSSPGGPGAWTEGLARLATWPAGPGLLALGGIASAAWRAATGRSGEAARAYHGVLTAIAVVSLLQFPFLPFSATFNRPYAGLEGIATRYLLLPFALGIALATALERVRAGRVRAYDLVAAVALASALPALVAYVSAAPARIAYAAAGAAVALAMGRSGPARLFARTSVTTGVVAAGFLVIVAMTPIKQRRTDGKMFAIARDGLAIGAGWRALDALPDGSRVAFFMSDPFEYTHFYPVFGRRLQHVPVPLDREGSPRPPLHLRAPRAWWADWDEIDDPVDPAVLWSRLVAARVDYVAVSRWMLGRWPAQREAIRAEASGRRPVYDDGTTEIWAVVADGAATRPATPAPVRVSTEPRPAPPHRRSP